MTVYRTQAAIWVVPLSVEGPPMVGILKGKGTLIMRQHVGEATDDEGREYELTLTMGMEPIVRSEQTGKYYILDWDDIISLAIEAGIDK